VTGPATIRTLNRMHVWTGRIPDASRRSGRLRAARQVLAESAFSPAILDRDPAGIPRVRSADSATGNGPTDRPDAPVAVSWSHSGDELAVVIADLGPVGIDLELITGRTPPERELGLVLRHARVRLRPPGCDAWCEWTVVEALVKAARCGLIGLITGRLLVIERGAGIEHTPTGQALIGRESPTVHFAVTTQLTRGDPDSLADQHQRWRIHHQHNGSRRLTVVVPG